jgi:hypothetical protein
MSVVAAERFSLPEKKFMQEVNSALVEEEVLMLGGVEPPNMSVPPVIFCETHDDPTHPETIAMLLPFFQAAGYRAVTYEFDKSVGGDAFVEALGDSAACIAEDLLLLGGGGEVKKRVGELANNLALIGMLQSVKNLNMEYQGLDADGIRGSNKLFIRERDVIIAKNLDAVIRRKEGGVVGCIGAGHAAGVKDHLAARLTKDAAQKVLFVRVGDKKVDAAVVKDVGIDLSGITYVDRSLDVRAVAGVVQGLVEARIEQMKSREAKRRSAPETLEDASLEAYAGLERGRR